MAIYYFDYGSNLSAQIMRDWCPDHRRLGAAQLIGWRLGFRRFSERWQAGVADIIADPDARVWGSLYEVTEADLAALDRKESNGQNYHRLNVQVQHAGTVYDAFTYTVIDKLAQDIPTSTAYRDTMLTGALELGLPADYIQRIVSVPVSD